MTSKKRYLLFSILMISFSFSFAQTQGIYSIYDSQDVNSFRVFEVIEHPTKLDANNEPLLLILGGLTKSANRDIKLIEFDIAAESITNEKTYGISNIREEGYKIIPRYSTSGIFLNRYHIIGSHQNSNNAHRSRDAIVVTLDENYFVATGLNAIDGVFGTEGDVEVVLTGTTTDRVSEYGRSAAISTNDNLVVLTCPNIVTAIDNHIPCLDSLLPIKYTGVALMEITPTNSIVQYNEFGPDNGALDSRNLFARDMVHDTRIPLNERFVITGRRDLDAVTDKNAMFVAIERDGTGSFQYVNGHGIDYYIGADPEDGSNEEMTSIDLYQADLGFDDGYVMVGTSTRNSFNFCTDCENIVFFLTDMDGNVQDNSAFYYGAEGDQLVSDVIAIPNDGFAILGSTPSVLDPTQNDLFLLRLNDNLTVRWTKLYGGNENETVRRLGGGRLIKRTGGFVIVGETFSYSQGANTSQNDLLVLLTNDEGEASLGVNSTCENEIVFERIEEQFLNERTWSDEVSRCHERVDLDLPLVAKTSWVQQNCGPSIASCEDPDSTSFNYVVPGVIPSGTTAYWDGKYFFPCGTILTVESGATLDLTNVDLMFEQCAGIVFEEGSFLRANNSVFRSCDPSYWWLGLTFEGDAYAELNECTFKNANQAIYLQGTNNSAADVNITNTLFSNNFVGIQAENVRLMQGITGNTFLIDDQMALVEWATYCDAVGCSIETPYTDYFGIRTLNSSFDYNISQNDFVSVLNNTATGLNFFGISLNNTNAEISANNFTDMFRSITISGETGGINIENNEIELTLGYEDETSQIQIHNSNRVFVSGNKIVSSVAVGGVGPQNSGIYFEDVANAHVVNNHIEGFHVGLNGLRLQHSYVGENTFMNNYIVGVLLTDGAQVAVACNIIDMEFGDGISAGYEYLQTNAGDAGMTFHSNCVTEGEYGVICFGPDLSILPSIKNNQFTNYQEAGIRNIGMSGSIGSGATAISAGRNTFFSNNIPNGAFDITSNTGINAMGNFGAYTVNALVNVSFTNSYSSSASCAEYGLTADNEILKQDVCDKVDPSFTLLLTNTVGENVLAPNFDDRISHTPSVYRVKQIKASMISLHNQGDLFLLTELVEAVTNSAVITIKEKQWVYFYAAYLQNNWELANSLLASILPASEEENDILYVEMLKTKWSSQVANGISLSYAEEQKLLEIFERNNAASIQAISLANQVSIDYRFKEQAQPYFTDLDQEQSFNLNENSISIWPNPANSTVAISVVLDEHTGGMLKLYSIQGELVYSQPINSNISVKTIDITNYHSGIYICVLENSEGQQAVTKLSKL